MMLEQQLANTTIIRRVLLIGGGICLVAAGICGLFSTSKPLKHATQPTQEDVQPQFQAEKLSAIPNLGVMVDEVRPLQQTTRVVASGQHSAEFRGTHFIQTNIKNYALEIFETNKEELIQDFLDKRSDRQKFIYLRLSIEHQPERYILLYGLYNSEDNAQEQLQQLNLGLPKSIHPKTVALKNYADLVNDMGADELSSNQQLYNVKLKPAAIPQTPVVPVAPASSTVTTTAPAVQTTITRKDHEGNVVSVTQSAGIEASAPH